MSANKFDIIIPPQDIGCMPGLQEKLSAGDRAAFAWVYKNYCRKLFDYAVLMTNDAEQSEDIVQDIFLKLWMNREKLKGIENFTGYIHMMCRNHVMNSFRRKKRAADVKRTYLSDAALTIHAVDDEINFRETKRLIAIAFKKLPKQPQKVIILSREYGMKRKEISKTLNKTELTVKNQLYEGVKLLREMVGR